MYGTWHSGIFGAFGVMGIVMTISMIAAYVIIIIAVWRAMRAHESLANSAKEIAGSLKDRKEQEI